MDIVILTETPYKYPSLSQRITSFGRTREWRLGTTGPRNERSTIF